MTTPRYYVQVIGPYDTTFIGAFTSIERANDYVKHVDRSVFDTYIMNEAAFRANVAQYGAVALQSPEVAQ